MLWLLSQLRVVAGASCSVSASRTRTCMQCAQIVISLGWKLLDAARAALEEEAEQERGSGLGFRYWVSGFGFRNSGLAFGSPGGGGGTGKGLGFRV